MTPDQIAEMKADMEAGTDGPWRVEDGTALIWGDCNPQDMTTRGMGRPTAECRTTPEFRKTRPDWDEGVANARRIARVPALEAEVLRIVEAVEGLAQAYQDSAEFGDQTIKDAAKDRYFSQALRAILNPEKSND